MIHGNSLYTNHFDRPAMPLKFVFVSAGHAPAAPGFNSLLPFAPSSAAARPAFLDTATSAHYILRFGLLTEAAAAGRFREPATRPYGRSRCSGNACSITRPSATLAQLVEHSIRNRKVVGSNPTGGSIKSIVYGHSSGARSHFLPATKSGCGKIAK